MRCSLIILFIFLSLSLVGNESLSSPTTVESDTANYNGQILILRGNVVVHNSMGRLCADEAQLTREEKDLTSQDFSWLHLSKNVTLTLINGSFLRCNTVDINSLASQAILTGSPQIYYKAALGELFADWAQIDYDSNNGTFEPIKVTLKGNVQMIASTPLSISNEKRENKFALADFVTYFPREEKITLYGHQGRRVLFYDPVKDFQLSAHTVHASRNADGKEIVQGMGDVQFVFKQDELDNLKQRFKWE